MAPKRVLEIDYTGSDAADHKVFDTTSESIARKNDMFEEKTLYRALIVAEGSGELLPALEEAVLTMKAGENRKIILPAEKAFGARNPDLVHVVPLQQFKKRNVQPEPGMDVQIDQYRGRVQSVSGGRVRVDFNHPLASKTIEYDLTLNKVFDTDASKTEALFRKFFVGGGEKPATIAVTAEAADVTLPGLADGRVQTLKQNFAQLTFNSTDKIKKIRFTESVERAEPAAKAPTASPATPAAPAPEKTTVSKQAKGK